MSDKMKNLIVRTLSGIVLLAIVMCACLWSAQSFALLCLAIMLGSLCEYYRICRKSNLNPQSLIAIFISLIIFGLFFIMANNMLNISTTYLSFVLVGGLLTILLGLYLVFFIELTKDSETPIANIGASLLGIIYITIPMTLLLFVGHIFNKNCGWCGWIMLCYIFLIWANDVFAYLVGMSIGRHHICERISPKKSWEGFIGGVIGALCCGLLFGHLLGQNIYVWGGLGLVIALSGVAGDFVESLFKRKAGIKDSGNILPGHGGFLDRFDALLLSAPFAFVYLIIITIFLN